MSTYHKILLGLVAAVYFISPVDLIPDLFIPYFGWVDDTVIVGIILYYLKNGRLPGFFNRKKRGGSYGKKADFRFSNDASACGNFSENLRFRGNQRSDQGAAASPAGKNRNEKNNKDPEQNENQKRTSNQGWHGGNRDFQFREASGSTVNQKEKKVRSPCEVLGIHSGASKNEIVAAYRKAVKEYHPDRVAHLGKDLQNLANQKFIEIREAYSQLIRSK